MTKEFPYSKDFIETLVEKYGSPFHIYDEAKILDNLNEMKDAFSQINGFKEYFAVKALPNPYILKILANQGIGADCSSLPELVLAQKAGIVGENIMFTSNNTPLDEFTKAKELGAVMNLDDISHIDFIDKNIGLPELLCFRYNPGPLKDGNEIIGKPQDAKYGFTTEQIFEGYEMLKNKGVKRFGIHTMIASNERNEEYFIETARILFDLVQKVHTKLGITFEFINLGGGIGIPYRPEDKKVSFKIIADGIKLEYDKVFSSLDFKPKIYFECGRVITGPYGYLITKVIHQKHIYKDYIGVDACMANLMRPALYGAYHHITVLGKQGQSLEHKYDVVGSLCENNDKFAIDRMLPKVEIGDIIAIHDTGAHGYAMGFNYNGKLRSKELLLRTDGSVVQIRREETIDDYFATLDMDGLKNFS